MFDSSNVTTRRGPYLANRLDLGMGKITRVVVCGMKGVGKTALLEQLIYGNVDGRTVSTRCDSLRSRVPYENDETYGIAINVTLHTGDSSDNRGHLRRQHRD